MKQILISFTKALDQKNSFSFLRLGDGEIRFLIENQQSKWKDGRYDRDLAPSCEVATGTLGLRRVDYERLLKSYEECDGLDLYLSQEYNRISIDKLKWRRNPLKWTISDHKDGGVINEWTRLEFKKYTSHHKSLICGAEAFLLRELIREPEYREIAREYIPTDGQLIFYEPPERGRNPSIYLDKIKKDIIDIITSERCDTVFISLGGAAKMLCYEIAKEVGVRAIDWGSMIRALTYSGSDGQSAWRASHNPFFFRIPLPLYYRCMWRAWPSLSISEILGKSHAQLCLIMQRKTIGSTVACDVHDPKTFDGSRENMNYFHEDYSFYTREIRPLAQGDHEKSLAREFEMWRLKKGIGLKGDIFLFLVRVKALLRSLKKRF